MEEWINDSTYFCETCEITFKVYALDDAPSVNFCPICASRDLRNPNEENEE